ncbi:PREDICTED: filamin-interacting protein FAM101B, partial [Myotis brandtii]|uniref:filamin-interacting protein FAM101B n=1 Tax=Myotis brandtii TaxID=109478 RepID=UPI000703C3E3
CSPSSQNPASLPTPLASACAPRLCPLSFGEGVEFDPLPPTEVRYTSSVKYDSDRHFIDDVRLPLGLAVASCSQTVTCIPNCTWRSYKAELRFEPRHKATRFLSTTIIYPKCPKTVYTTTLDYNCRKTLRRFLSSVELEASEFPGGGDYLSDECWLGGLLGPASSSAALVSALVTAGPAALQSHSCPQESNLETPLSPAWGRENVTAS